MIKVKFWENESWYDLQEWINNFGESHKIVNVSFSTNRDYRNIVCVMYEEGEQNG